MLTRNPYSVITHRNLPVCQRTPMGYGRVDCRAVEDNKVDVIPRHDIAWQRTKHWRHHRKQMWYDATTLILVHSHGIYLFMYPKTRVVIIFGLIFPAIWTNTVFVCPSGPLLGKSGYLLRMLPDGGRFQSPDHSTIWWWFDDFNNIFEISLRG